MRKKNVLIKPSEFDKGAKEMKFSNVLDDHAKEVGKDTKVVKRRITLKSSGPDGTIFGYKTIHTKESEEIVTEDLTELQIGKIKSNISKGAKDLEQKWKDALHLTNKAFEVSEVSIPHLGTEDWKIYEDLIAYAVKQLAKTRGLKDSSWRISQTIAEQADHIGRHRYFVDIPGEGTIEVFTQSLESLMKQLSDRLRKHGRHVQIEEKNKDSVTFSVWQQNVKRDKITVRKV